MKILRSIVLSVIVPILFLSCEKNYQKKIKGEYYFTTQSSNSYYNDSLVFNDSIIYYYGSISEANDGVIKIDYAPHIDFPLGWKGVSVLGKIEPTIDKEGILTYPDFIGPHNKFEGNLTNKDEIEIEFKLTYGGNGISFYEKVIGKKL